MWTRLRQLISAFFTRPAATPPEHIDCAHPVPAERWYGTDGARIFCTSCSQVRLVRAGEGTP